MKPSHRLTRLILKLLSYFCKNSPRWILYSFSSLIFLLLFYIFRLRKNLVLQNLKLAFPNESDDWQLNIAKKCYRFYVNNFINFFALPKSFSKSFFEVHGQDNLSNALNTKNGVITVSGHFGVWEYLSAWLGTNNYPLTVVTMKQKNRGSDQFFQDQRGQFGVKQIYRKSTLDNMYKIIEENGMLGLVSDQDAKKRGVFVDFFGQPTSTPKGAARFHIESGAPLVFAISYQDAPNQYKIYFHKVDTPTGATIQSITQNYTSILEEYIRRYPEQYFWFHRRWKTKPDNH